MASLADRGRVLVLTVDPAKRLASALGLSGVGNEEHRVPDDVLWTAGLAPRGELWVAMLDTKESWDSLVHRYAPDEKTASRILANPLYQNISGQFVQSHDYIAMERLYDIHLEGRYDLIVIDTPPSRNALDFLSAPQRMADFFSSRFLRWLVIPYRSRLLNIASRPFYQVADRVLGTQFLSDISEFFMLFQAMYEGFVQRAEAVKKLLKDDRTTFIVVSTLEPAPAREAELFVQELSRRELDLGAVVLNKVLPSYLRDPHANKIAERMRRDAPTLAAKLSLPVGYAEHADRVLTEVAESFSNFSIVAYREAAQKEGLGNYSDIIASVPFFDTDIFDLAGLARLGERLFDR
jgi:anion-transporting  ArsA/GET3 family ATPase